MDEGTYTQTGLDLLASKPATEHVATQWLREHPAAKARPGEQLGVRIVAAQGYPESFARENAQTAASEKAEERGMTASNVELSTVYKASHYWDELPDDLIMYEYVAYAVTGSRWQRFLAWLGLSDA